MTRSLAASDRSALIRLAASLPKGSEERRTILAGLSKNAGKTAFPISALSKGGGTVGPAEIQRAVARAGFTKSYLEGLDFTHIEFDAVEKAVTVPGEGVEAIWRVFPKGQFDNRNSDYVWGTVTLSMQSSPAGIHVVGIIMVKD